MNEEVMKTESNTPEIPDGSQPAQPVEAVDVTEVMVENALQAYISEAGTVDSRDGDLLPIDDEAMRAALTAALAHPRPAADGMVSVVVEDANNYCRILAALGMEEEGDPVAEVERLMGVATAAPTAEQAGEMVEPKWPGPWNGHHFPVDAIAQVFGKAAFEAATILRLGPPNHSEIGVVLLQQLGAAGFGICRDQPRPVGVPDGWKLVPVEPTSSMVVNGFESASEFTDSEEFEEMSGCQGAAETARVTWRAMLAAAPAPAKAGGA